MKYSDKLKQRVFDYRTTHSLTPSEIAKIMDMPVSLVYRLCHLAKRKLGIKIQPYVKKSGGQQ